MTAMIMLSAATFSSALRSDMAEENWQAAEQRRLAARLGMALRPTQEPLTGSPVLSELSDTLPEMERPEQTLWDTFELQQPSVQLRLYSLEWLSNQGMMDANIPYQLQLLRDLPKWRFLDLDLPDPADTSLWRRMQSAWLGRTPPLKIILHGKVPIEYHETSPLNGLIEIRFGEISYLVEVWGKRLSQIVDGFQGIDEDLDFSSLLEVELGYALPLVDDQVIYLNESHNLPFTDSFSEAMELLSSEFDEMNEGIVETYKSVNKTIGEVHSRVAEKLEEDRRAEEEEDEDEDDEWTQ